MHDQNVLLSQDQFLIFFNSDTKSQSPKNKLSLKRKPDTLIIQRKNNNEIVKSQKKTNFPKPKRKPIPNLFTEIDSRTLI